MLLLAASGCNRAPSVEDVRAEAGEITKLVPGAYETRMTITRIEAPGLPAAQREALERELGKGAQVSETCITPQQADQGIQPMLDNLLQQRQCQFEKFSVSGKAIAGELACSTGLGPTARMKLDGTVEPEQISAKTNMSVKLPFPPIGIDVAMDIDMKRTGTCQAAPAGGGAAPEAPPGK